MVSMDGTVIARGLVNYSAAELPQMLGRSTKELGKALGRGYDREVVHVDDLVLV
jgi:glutamate 5-kinase